MAAGRGCRIALNYNGIAFVYPLTKTHSNGPVKDPSGSDQLFTEITIEAESLLNVQLLPATIQDGNAATVLARVRHYLTQPRGALYYDFSSLPGATGASPVINIPDGRDDGTGPWPDEKGFRISYTTPNTLLVNWSCTVRIRDCGDPNVASFPLSLRWEDSLSWDSNWKATYTRNGTCILSSKSDQAQDWYRRRKFAPPVPPGFRRSSSRYTVSRDQLRCDFTTTDEQIRFAPPGNGVEMSIVQSESAPISPIVKGAVSVQISGIQNSSVIDMSRWALIVMLARVQAARPLVAGGGATLLGLVNLETRETTTGVDVSATCSYKADINRNRQVGVIGGLAAAWAALIPKAQIVGAGGRLTQQGLPSGLSKFPWVGFGTSPASQTNPGGYAQWANNTSAIGGPADGVGLAKDVTLFAALLNDPCGNALYAQPNAQDSVLTAGLDVSLYNTPEGGGQGGKTPVNDSFLYAAYSSLDAAQYPATISLDTADALWNQDGLPGVYDHWQTYDEYMDDPGTLVVPVCNPNGTNRRVNYSSAMFTLYRRWAAKRTGAPPRIPPRLVNKPSGEVDPNWVYVAGSPAPGVRELGLAADGVNFVYEATGVYIFQALDASQVSALATIPPFIDPIVGASVAGWINGAALVANGTLGVGSSGGGDAALFGFSGSFSSPLGSGSLMFTVNP